MFETSRTVLGQVITLFLLMGTGFVITKLKMLSNEGNRQITGILLYIVTPCLIINSFTGNFSRAMFTKLALSFALAFGVHLISILFSLLLFREQKPNDRSVLRFSVIYSNCAFMGIPLIGALLGEEGVMYGAVYIAVFNALAWTQGIFSMSGGKKFRLLKIIVNPGMIGIILALPLVLFDISIPLPIGQSLSFLAGLNTPLAMLVIGFHMANTQLKEALLSGRVYLAAFFRLAAIPLIVIAVLALTNFDPVLERAMILSACAPTAASCTLMAAKCGVNTQLSSRCVALSTLFSVVTIPLIYAAAEYLI